MQSHQLNALIAERPSVKVATSQICSDLVLGKSGNIVGDPTFINTIVGSVIFSNYKFNSVSDKTTTQATLHSRFARVGEYPFSNSVIAGLRPNFASQNSTKLNIQRLHPNFIFYSRNMEQLNNRR
jgi:hypothetical protein